MGVAYSVTFSPMGNVTLGKRFRWVHRCRPENFVGYERTLTGAIVCVITKSAILISAQFRPNISPHYSFMVQNQITVSLCLSLL